jgi:hypothetical protein
MDHKVNGCDIVIVHEDAVKRLELGLFFLLFDDLNLRDNFYFHG